MAKTWDVVQPQIQDDFSGTINQYPAASGVTLKAGTFTTLTSGLLNPIAANSTSLATAGLLAGIALGPATYAGGLGAGIGDNGGNISANVPTFRARAGQRVVMTLSGAAGADLVATAAMLGGKYGLYIDANGIAHIDESNTAQPYVEIIKFGIENDQVLGAVGDTNPPVLVELLAAGIQ